VGDTNRQTVFHHAEVEFTKLTNLIAERVEKTKAARVAIDSLSELRHLGEEKSAPPTGSVEINGWNPTALGF
jgi:hypothetical protein